MVARLAGTADPGVGPERGLYDPALDKDSCGVGFIADIKGQQIPPDRAGRADDPAQPGTSRRVGADPRAGDGAGILVQIPHKFFAKKLTELGLSLPGARANTRSARCSCRATTVCARRS